MDQARAPVGAGSAGLRTYPPPTGQTIALTGATGLIGRAVCRTLAARGDRVVALVRRPGAPLEGAAEQRPWSTAAPAAPLQSCSAVVHLAGEPVAEGRWSARRKAAILASRVGRPTSPAKAQRHGFRFRHATLDGALRDLLP